MNHFEVGVMVAGAICCAAAAIVVLTYWQFPIMREKRFMKFIFYISFSDFCVGIASILGFPNKHSVCMAQGMIATFFSNASWLWATSLSYTMYCIVRRTPTIHDKYLHVLCWGVSAINTFIPMTFRHFRYLQGNPRDQWCFLQPSANTSEALTEFVSFGMYWFWLFLCVILMSVWGLNVYCRILQAQENSPSADIIRHMYDKVWLYPVVIGSCWIINFFVDGTDSRTSNLLSFISVVAGTSSGFFTALLFLWKSEEAKYRWKQLLIGLKETQISEELLYYKVPIDFEPDESYDSLHLTVTPADDSVMRSSRISSSSAISSSSGSHMTSLNSQFTTSSSSLQRVKVPSEISESRRASSVGQALGDDL